MGRSLVVSNVQETTKKPTQKRKSFAHKNHPLKVVYISNPMRVHASASEFRALVQELTGRDAEFPDPTKFPSMVEAQDMNLVKKQELGEGDDDELLLLDAPLMEDSNSNDFLKSSYASLEEIFSREMMENWPPLLPHF